MSATLAVLGAVAALATAGSINRKRDKLKTAGKRVRWSREYLSDTNGAGEDWEGTIIEVERSRGTRLAEHARNPSQIERRHLSKKPGELFFYPFGTWFYSVRWDTGPGRPLINYEIPDWKLEIIEQLPQHQGSSAKLTGRARVQTLLRDGAPKWIRLYDNGGRTADRYTVVFTGKYKKERGYSMGFHSAADPRNGSGWVEFGPLDYWRWPDGTLQVAIDRPRTSHLGKKIGWDKLPEKLQKMAMADYCGLWELDITGLQFYRGRYRFAQRRSLRENRNRGSRKIMHVNKYVEHGNFTYRQDDVDFEVDDSLDPNNENDLEKIEGALVNYVWRDGFPTRGDADLYPEQHDFFGLRPLYPPRRSLRGLRDRKNG